MTRRYDDAVRVLRELRDLPVPVEVIVVDDALLERESSVPGIVRVALREGRTVDARRLTVGRLLHVGCAGQRRTSCWPSTLRPMRSSCLGGRALGSPGSREGD